MCNQVESNVGNARAQLENAGIDYEISGMLWMQGESDSETVEMAKMVQAAQEAVAAEDKNVHLRLLSLVPPGL